MQLTRFVLLQFFLGTYLLSSAQLLLEDDRVVIGNEVNVNSTDLDFSPMYYRDGIVYVTTHVDDLRYKVKDDKIKMNIMKLGQAGRSFSGVLYDPKPFYKELSSSLHEGPVSFDSSYTKIYFTRNEETKKKRKKSLRRLRIYTADFIDEEWENERLVDFNEEGANTAHPALSPDGNLLIFTSDRDGGYGGMDLWAVAKTNGDWGDPYNLGSAINTDGNDVFPYLHEDGTLYFSSTTEAPDNEEGHLDIYYARMTQGKWGKGTALGPPFNSDDDDFGLIVDKSNKKGYFSSDRPGGLGGDDIYSFQIFTTRTGGPLDLTLDVSDSQSGDPIDGASITYLNTADISLAQALGDGLISGTAVTGLELTGGQTAATEPSGRRTLRVSSGEYLIRISKEGFESVQLPLKLDKGDITLPIALNRVSGCNELKIVVLDEQSLAPVSGARVVFSPQTSGNPREVASDEDGVAFFCAPCEEIFGIAANLNGRRSRPASYDTRGTLCKRGEETTMTLYLRTPDGFSGFDEQNPLVVGSILQLPSVYYPWDRWELSVDARNDLNHLAAIMERYPGMKVELGSHTDAQGDKAYNKALSQRRASEAKRYLVTDARIAANRISAIGYGESQIKNRCVDGVRCPGVEHRENRRTEIKVTHVDNPIAIPLELKEAANQGVTFENTPHSAASTQTSGGQGSSMQASDSKRYWVVAGTFQDRNNAEKRQLKLEDLGYAETSIVTFSGTSGKAVVVGKFAQLKDAAEFSRAIKEAHRIGAYVRKIEVRP